MSSAAAYWEERAQRFSAAGRGLRAVCAYGMPGFYNAAIDLAQRRALEPWLRRAAGERVLDVGCGIGRWSRRLAGLGAQVTGVDHSATMLSEARRRAEADGVIARCRFVQADLATLDLGERFPVALGVTVLQHVVPEPAFHAAAARLARHVAARGRLLLLEAAPPRALAPVPRQNFRARSAEDYRAAFAAEGLRLTSLWGVDPLPLKIAALPLAARLPRPLGWSLLAVLAAATLPLELAFGPSWPSASWHKLLVLERGGIA